MTVSGRKPHQTQKKSTIATLMTEPHFIPVNQEFNNVLFSTLEAVLHVDATSLYSIHLPFQVNMTTLCSQPYSISGFKKSSKIFNQQYNQPSSWLVYKTCKSIVG